MGSNIANLYQAPFSKEDFMTAPKGAAIIDVHDRVWEFADEPQGEGSLRLVVNPNGDQEYLRFSNMFAGGPHVVDSEMAIVIELNQSAARIDPTVPEK